MMKAKNELPYDRTDRQSIYRYAIDLRGSTLREKTDADEISDIRRNKGSFGSAVETRYFMLDLNNESEADFKEAGLELKTTPLKRNKDGRLTAKDILLMSYSHASGTSVFHDSAETFVA